MAAFLTALALGLAVAAVGRTGPVLVATDPGPVPATAPTVAVREAPVPTTVAADTVAVPLDPGPSLPPTTRAPVAPKDGGPAAGDVAAAETRAAASPPATAPATTTSVAATTTAPVTITTPAIATTTTLPPPATTTTTSPPTTSTPTTSTTLSPSPTTVPPGAGPLTVEEARLLFAGYFGESDLDIALRVAQCESGLDPGAYNPSGPGYGGLFQHALTAWDARAAAAGWAGAGVFDPVANTAVTAWLVATDGWGHWPNC